MAGMIKILSLDGGGIRGLMSAMVLARIEESTSTPIARLFDLIAGTSTGAILALGLTKPGADGGQPAFAARDLTELYEKQGPRIFSRSVWHTIAAADDFLGPKYPARGLESVLAERFGEARLKDALTEVLVPAYELESREPWFFARHKARRDAAADFPMKDVARAASAAPTYFPPYQLPGATVPGSTQPAAFIDGGVFANNPTMCGYVEARKIHPDATEFLVASVGTGQHTRPIHYRNAKGWGIASWAVPILDVVFDGVSDTVDHQMAMLCANGDGRSRYYRFQIELDRGSDDLDDTSPRNIELLVEEARTLLEQQRGDLDALCEQLRAEVVA